MLDFFACYSKLISKISRFLYNSEVVAVPSTVSLLSLLQLQFVSGLVYFLSSSTPLITDIENPNSFGVWAVDRDAH